MSTLLLKLAAPLQSWGAESRFSRRDTRHEPTKSAIIGLVAAAQGRRRTDSIEDLLGLSFGVRIDQPGVVLRDFHTAHNAKQESMPLSDRYYLSDAVFVAGLEAERGLLESIAEAFLHPVFPLFLGRRSCVPSGKLVLGLVDEDLISALRHRQWEASIWFQRRLENRGLAEIELELVRDCLPGETVTQIHETVRDIPLSFSQEQRRYGWRDVIHDKPATVANPSYAGASENLSAPSHDPMTAL